MFVIGLLLVLFGMIVQEFTPKMSPWRLRSTLQPQEFTSYDWCTAFPGVLGLGLMLVSLLLWGVPILWKALP